MYQFLLSGADELINPFLGPSADDNTKGNNDADWLLGIEGGDTTVEQILLSIQAAQDRVFSLRSNLKQAMAKNKGITLKVNTWVNGTQSSNCSPGKGKVGGLNERSPQETSDCDIDDSAMPDSALSSYGEASNMDIFESTMTLLSEGPHQMGEFREVSFYTSVVLHNNTLIQLVIPDLCFELHVVQAPKYIHVWLSLKSSYRPNLAVDI